ncbi:HNH endonuclease [Methylobacterium fujisawaense]
MSASAIFRLPVCGDAGFVVDEGDASLVAGLSWHRTGTKGGKVYAQTKVKGKRVLLHRLLLNAPADLEVDHRDGDTRNNRRSNLRIATHAQNMANRRMLRNNTSGFRGVSFRVGRGWCAEIYANGVRKHLGYFREAVIAARAYDVAASSLHGEFAALNFRDADRCSHEALQ